MQPNKVVPEKHANWEFVTPGGDTALQNEGWGSVDTLLTVVMAVTALIWTFAAIHWRTAPAEDALMLLRYARHLAAGHGITWNIGDHPVEGATDFLFMVLIAGCLKVFHAGAIETARVILLFSHAATVAVVFTGARKLFGASRSLAIALAIYLMLGPGILLASDDFSGPIYALVAMCCWWNAWTIFIKGISRARVVAFAVLGLTAGLIRPDGVLLAVILTAVLVGFLVANQRRAEAYQVAAVVVVVFAILGGLYFFWRFHYFGYLLPNPFYKKGGGHLYPSSLHYSAINIFKMLLPLVPIAAVGVVKRNLRQRTLFVFLPCVLFSLIWILLTNENNMHMRFQYVVIPLTLMSIPYISQGMQIRSFRMFGSEGFSRVAFSAILTFVVGGMYWKILYELPQADNGSGAYNIASGLAKWQDRGYTMALTEAGVIPYFSNWRVIDVWGLNDSDIMHNKRGLTTEYLDVNHPAIIMFHLSDTYGREGFNQIWRGDAPARIDPAHFMMVLSNYAATHNYELAARWGDSACSVHVWYVRRDLPESSAMIDLIRQTPHFFLDTQRLSYDYRNDPPPVACIDPGFVIPPKS